MTMRIILAALLLTIIPPALAAGQEGATAPPDFRQVRWGMSPEEVKAAETRARPAGCQGGDNPSIAVLCYIAPLNGIDYDLFYTFMDGKLARAVYYSRQEYQNKNNYVNDYETLKGELTQRYGPPKNDETTWSGTLYQDSPEHLGLAYSSGDVLSYASWETERSYFSVEISGENYKVDLAIYYYAKAAYHELMTRLRGRTLDDL